MNLIPINTGNFKLDGGAMHGVVPKSMWKHKNPPDEKNMCSWAMRCMLVEDGDRLILIDNGLGDKQSEKFFGFYFLHGDDTLDKSLAAHSFHRDDITDVFLTHLHFDHCGGSVKWNKDRTGYEPAFKNAKFWSNELHWKWATEPNPREKASFLKENILPIKESGQLEFVQIARNDEADNLMIPDIFPGFSALTVNGHTDAMMIPHIEYKGRTVVFMADLLPSVGHIPLAWVMGYDTRPLLTLKEKKDFLQMAVEKDYVLFFEHDAVNECCSLISGDRGPMLGEIFKLSEF
jgi:glyoxylase-like metal-dependent hydrolase (beta-lactamase superfamily II)